MPTLDERIEAARKLEGYTPGPWCVSPTDDTTIIALDRSVVAEIDGDYNEPDLWPIMEANARVVAAAPDLHRLALDLAAERERLLAICRDVPAALNSAFAAGTEECEGGSARRQEKALAPVDDMRKRIRAALNQETIND